MCPTDTSKTSSEKEDTSKMEDLMQTDTSFHLKDQDGNKVYNRLINEAPFLPGDCNIPILPKYIPWVNPKLLEDGRKFARDNYFSTFLSTIMATVVVFTVKSICICFLRTGKAHRYKYDSFLKLATTANRIMTWMEDDVLSMDSNSFKNIEVTRLMHKAVADWRNRGKDIPSEDAMEISEETKLFARAINKDLEFVDTSQAPRHLFTWTAEVEFSQFDNAVFLWSLSSWPMMMAKNLGISDLKLFPGYQHMWAVFGRLLGIEDRFNVALHYSPELSQNILINILVASLKEIDLPISVTQKIFTTIVQKVTLYLRHKTLLYLMLKGLLPEFEGKNMYALMSRTEKFSLFVAASISRLVVRFRFARKLMNWRSKKLLDDIVGKHIPKFRKNYPCPKFEENGQY